MNFYFYQNWTELLHPKDFNWNEFILIELHIEKHEFHIGLVGFGLNIYWY